MTAPKITTLDNWHVRAPKAPQSAKDPRLQIVTERGVLVLTLALGASIERDKALASLVAQTPRVLAFLRSAVKADLGTSAALASHSSEAAAILASAGL